MSTDCDRAEYNSKVQDMQRFCISAGLDNRVHPQYGKSKFSPDLPELEAAYFEVFYTDWRRIGTQYHPMTPRVSYIYDEIEDMKIRGEVSRRPFRNKENLAWTRSRQRDD